MNRVQTTEVIRVILVQFVELCRCVNIAVIGFLIVRRPDKLGQIRICAIVSFDISKLISKGNHFFQVSITCISYKRHLHYVPRRKPRFLCQCNLAFPLIINSLSPSDPAITLY